MSPSFPNPTPPRRPLALRRAALALVPVLAGADDAVFVRAVNLNGPALTIDGRPWEAEAQAAQFKAEGKRFENQQVPLTPDTDPARAQMIRGSVWGSPVTLTFRGLAPGPHQVRLHVWEDNHSESFDVSVNGKTVLRDFQSGTAGAWKRLGPWTAEPVDGVLTLRAEGKPGAAANLSGVEVWSGAGGVGGEPRFAESPGADELAFFESRIRPALIEHCHECHSASAESLKGGLLLDSRAGVRQGGEHGAVIVPGDPEASRLIRAVRRTDESLAMPPKHPLPPEVVADLERWVRLGAPDPRGEDTPGLVQQREEQAWEKARDWWSFRPLTRPDAPVVRDASWPSSPVDHFILARLEQAGLSPAPDADKRALIRRATYDLTGLPPSPEEVARFVADPAPDAFARLVDRLLASPRYGERWGRHWLDVVRYADTAGDNSDFPIPAMHRYRDWVIAAFNRDRPYDEFVRDQLAGDLRGGRTEEERQARIVATGYLANARRFGSRVDDYPWHLTIEDTLDNIGRAFLGLTLNCARCHDHKYDPIPTSDYYALYGIFQSTRYPWPGIELDKRARDFTPLVEPGREAAAQEEIAARRTELVRLEGEVKKRKEALDKAAKDEKPGLEAAVKEAEKAVRDHEDKPLSFALAYAVADAARPGDAKIQLKGDPAKPGAGVPRKFLRVLGDHRLPDGCRESGRAELADWILHPDNPLPARVMANRVWLHHFGAGLVPTPNDFGRLGKPPSHPALLDYLAVSFRDNGWSVKHLHRLILNSRAYRQGTRRDPAALERDPSHTLLAGYPRRRLDAESLRDTLLAAGGNLDLSPAGSHPFPPPHERAYTQHKPFKAVYDSERRSVYLMTQRIQRHPFLAIFDGADPSASTPARTASITPVQALYFLNDPFVHAQAARVAERLFAHSPDDGARIRFAHELLFARPPHAEEVAAALNHLAAAAETLRAEGVSGEDLPRDSWQSLVRSWFRLNEFLYLD